MNEIKTSTYIDLRGLAFFRMAFGALIFYLLLARLPELRTFYTDWGTLPREVLLQKHFNQWSWSLYLITGNIVLVGLLFALHFLINFLFFLGIQTRLMTFLNWVFLFSLFQRHVMVLHGGDDLLKLMLFMSIFLPLGAKYSVDSFLLNKDERPSVNIHFSLATFGFILQLLCMYFFTGLLKDSPVYTEEGTAIWYTLQLERFITPFGAMFKSFPPSATYLLTKSIFYMECIFPFIFLIPWKNNFFRYLTIFTFISFHLGLSLFMYLDYFPYVCIACWITLLPQNFWDHLEFKLKKPLPKSITIFYDNECNFCRKISRVIQGAFFLPYDSLKEIQSEDIPTKLMSENNSWVIKSDDHYFTKYAGFHELLINSPINRILIPGLISKLILKIGLGDFLYRFVSNKRSFFSRISRKIAGVKSSLNQSVPTKIFMVMILSTIVYTNILTLVPDDDKKPIPATIFAFRTILGLHQYWGLFAPSPMRDDGWLTIEGTLFNEKIIDIWKNGAPISDKKPISVYKNTKGTMWNKYILNLWDAKNFDERLYFGRYICRLWNDAHPNEGEQVSTFTIYYYLEKTPDAFSKEKETVEKVSFWTHDCWN
jgi:predicted DCC family thiol-disulfide oxidoreductase YuxK